MNLPDVKHNWDKQSQVNQNVRPIENHSNLNSSLEISIDDSNEERKNMNRLPVENDRNSPPKLKENKIVSSTTDENQSNNVGKSKIRVHPEMKAKNDIPKERKWSDSTSNKNRNHAEIGCIERHLEYFSIRSSDVKSFLQAFNETIKNDCVTTTNKENQSNTTNKKNLILTLNKVRSFLLEECLMFLKMLLIHLDNYFKYSFSRLCKFFVTDLNEIFRLLQENIFRTLKKDKKLKIVKSNNNTNSHRTTVESIIHERLTKCSKQAAALLTKIDAAISQYKCHTDEKTPIPSNNDKSLKKKSKSRTSMKSQETDVSNSFPHQSENIPSNIPSVPTQQLGVAHTLEQSSNQITTAKADTMIKNTQTKNVKSENRNQANTKKMNNQEHKKRQSKGVKKIKFNKSDIEQYDLTRANTSSIAKTLVNNESTSKVTTLEESNNDNFVSTIPDNDAVIPVNGEAELDKQTDNSCQNNGSNSNIICLNEIIQELQKLINTLIRSTAIFTEVLQLNGIKNENQKKTENAKKVKRETYLKHYLKIEIDSLLDTIIKKISSIIDTQSQKPPNEICRKQIGNIEELTTLISTLSQKNVVINDIQLLENQIYKKLSQGINIEILIHLKKFLISLRVNIISIRDKTVEDLTRNFCVQQYKMLESNLDLETKKNSSEKLDSISSDESVNRNKENSAPNKVFNSPGDEHIYIINDLRATVHELQDFILVIIEQSVKINEYRSNLGKSVKNKKGRKSDNKCELLNKVLDKTRNIIKSVIEVINRCILHTLEFNDHSEFKTLIEIIEEFLKLILTLFVNNRLVKEQLPQHLFKEVRNEMEVQIRLETLKMFLDAFSSIIQ